MHGLGVYTWKIGDKYIGEVHYGRIHGFGTYTWRTNSKYVGQWKDGRMHGNGVKTDPHGAHACRQVEEHTRRPLHARASE